MSIGIYNDMKNNGVSVCVTAYNAKEYIKECLDSIVKQTWFQTHKDYEILVGVDGCKNTLEYLKTIMPLYKNLRVFMMDSNKGTYITSNTLMKIASYENLFRFDSDDIMLPRLIETIMKKKGTSEYVRYHYINSTGGAQSDARGAIYLSKSLFLKYGGFRPWRCAADTELCLRLQNVVDIKLLPDVLMKRTVRDDSLTKSEETGMKSELRAEYKKLTNELNVSKPEDAIIKCETNTYKEIITNKAIQEGVSICISAYKAKDFLKECLDSVAAQTWFKNHTNWEIIVGVDGCEETLEYLKNIMHNYNHLRVFMMDSNKGTYVTCNTMISNATYENIFRFDSDDIMCPNLVETVLKKKGSSQFVRFHMRNFGKDNTVAVAWGIIYITKSLFFKFGGYKPWPCGADSDFYFRLRRLVRINTIPDILMKRRVHNASLTQAKTTGMGSEFRKQYAVQVNRNIRTKEDATIECVTNTFKEITPPLDIVDSKDYYIEKQGDTLENNQENNVGELVSNQSNRPFSTPKHLDLQIKKKLKPQVTIKRKIPASNVSMTKSRYWGTFLN